MKQKLTTEQIVNFWIIWIKIYCAIVALAIGLSLTAEAKARIVSEPSVRAACTGDYFKFCSHTLPCTDACKQCFRVTGPKLSAVCLSALRRSKEFGAEYKRTRIRVRIKGYRG